MNEINKTTDQVLASLGLGQPKPAKAGDKLGQEDFLKLLTTQLKNQDPLKPLENGDFLAQIAQFSTVSGIGDLKDSFDNLAGAMFSNQALQASVLVGRSVLIPSSTGQLVSGDNIAGAVDLPGRVDSLTIEVADASGQLIRSINLGKQDAGQASFVWDGLDNNGNATSAGIYQFRAIANAGGQEAELGTLIEDAVTSVTLGSGGAGMSLNLATFVAIPIDQVKQIK